MKLLSLLTIYASNFTKHFNMKNYKQLYCIKDKDKNVRYILCESKFEALDRIRHQDNFKHPATFYTITRKKL